MEISITYSHKEEREVSVIQAFVIGLLGICESQHVEHRNSDQVLTLITQEAKEEGKNG